MAKGLIYFSFIILSTGAFCQYIPADTTIKPNSKNLSFLKLPLPTQNTVKQIALKYRTGTVDLEKVNIDIKNSGIDSKAVDPNELVQYVLHESYEQTKEDLEFYAAKVKYFNSQKALMKKNVDSLRKYNEDLNARMRNTRDAYDSLTPKKIDENKVKIAEYSKMENAAITSAAIMLKKNKEAEDHLQSVLEAIKKFRQQKSGSKSTL